MDIPYLGILLAALAAWLFGAAWYGVLGRRWMAALGWSPAEIESRRQVKQMPLRPMLISFLCEFLMAWVFAYVLTHMSVVGWNWGAMTGLIVGVGFMAPATLVNNVFPGRKPMLSVIDGVHWIVVALIQGTILGAFV